MKSEKILSELELLLEESNSTLNVTGRQRMLSQKIAFLCQMVIRGENNKIVDLQKAIDLFDKSLIVIKEGGTPPQISLRNALPPLDVNLKSSLDRIESLWRLYKLSAENIIKFASQFGSYTSKSNNIEMLSLQIKSIENNCDSLLNSCDNLVSNYASYSKARILLMVTTTMSS